MTSGEMAQSQVVAWAASVLSPFCTPFRLTHFFEKVLRLRWGVLLSKDITLKDRLFAGSRG